MAALAGACGHGNQGNNGYKEKRTNAQNLEKSMGSVKGKMNIIWNMGRKNRVETDDPLFSGWKKESQIKPAIRRTAERLANSQALYATMIGHLLDGASSDLRALSNNSHDNSSLWDRCQNTQARWLKGAELLGLDDCSKPMARGWNRSEQCFKYGVYLIF